MNVRYIEDSRRKRTLTCCAIGLGLVFLIVLTSNRDAPEVSSVSVASSNVPHGGVLLDLLVPVDRRQALKEQAAKLPSYQLNDRQLCDIELLLNGGFSPLDGFMNESTWRGVVEEMRLPNGLLWPMPINLDVSEDDKETFSPGDQVALRDSYFNLIAVITVEDVYKPDKALEARNAYGTEDDSHPAVSYLKKGGKYYVGGTLTGFQLPPHYDFKDIRRTPQQVRAFFKEHGWGRVVAFQTRNPMHRAHIELTRKAAQQLNANILIHPVVGMTKSGDIDYATRVRCYKAIVDKKQYYTVPPALSLLPIAMRMAGPREALWHALIRKNYGATHFIIGRDHAGVKSKKTDKDFYGGYDAQNLANKYANELGISVVLFQNQVYVPKKDQYVAEDTVDKAETMSISGTEVRKRLEHGTEIPAWFSDPDVVKLLREVNPPLLERGVTLFFTGLSGSGKTTVAHALIPVLNQFGTRRVTLLDGDVVRTYLSKGLTFSKEDRETNVVRVGYVASEITRNGGLAVISAIAPYESGRQEVRKLVSAQGGFVEVYMSTSLEECEKRDPKGLYKKAREGLMPGFTGIDDPYEAPSNPEINIDGAKHSIEESVEIILSKLVEFGYLPSTKP